MRGEGTGGQIIVIDKAVGINIHNGRLGKSRDRHGISPVNMDMAVQHQFRLYPLQQIPHDFESGVG